MHQLANELNDTIKSKNRIIYKMLSDLGKEMFYPKGILTQSEEANEKANNINATIGTATEDNKPMYLESIKKKLPDLDPNDIFPYVSPSGLMELREAWKDKLESDNSLAKAHISLPIVTNAITHGLSIVADLFCNPDDIVILPDMLWGNYRMTFEVRRNAKFSTYKFFDEENKLNISGLDAELGKVKKDKVIVLLNFPNNPTGYTPTVDEANKVVDTLLKYANLGKEIVVVVDDAYYGLFYEDSIKTSIFFKLINKHSNILPIKLDGATKEHFVWGLRVGFLTLPLFENELVNQALELKIKGIIRSTISSGSHPSQTIVLDALKNPDFEAERKSKFEILKKRAVRVKSILNKEEKFNEYFTYYPFNSGYFMCLKLHSTNAEKLRLLLLDEYGIGTIAISHTDLRIAFSSVEECQLETLFNHIYEAAKKIESVR
ncbi:aminotransferase class I/II-fold pyridoxal phosphate-dependent enzyme [Salipaludibacillus sp. LMS25]|uniref:aminotransferase class I/II-fold pyridoxal phosphate-dependent enzyme n=1 Tax=Salipaludibacillus sp. LMS25 TaxID=2924031 RepID=UPI0020D0FA11|nr:aminotransferase class I/II-fold pyridoxal phosphate-dependent enzyme [Salipaludibacillus sp. LMS25]UTR13429.1 aminotransferase class I/II-fold pyridoxal phosphate-dependent enzyme [Salipaludibacillus sp. LMS25]